MSQNSQKYAWERAFDVLRSSLANKLRSEHVFDHRSQSFPSRGPKDSKEIANQLEELRSRFACFLDRVEKQTSDYFSAVESQCQRRAESRITALQQTVAAAAEVTQEMEDVKAGRAGDDAFRSIAQRLAAIQALYEDCQLQLSALEGEEQDHRKTPPIYIFPAETTDLGLRMQLLNTKSGTCHCISILVSDQYGRITSLETDVAPGLQTLCVPVPAELDSVNGLWIVAARNGVAISNQREWVEPESITLRCAPEPVPDQEVELTADETQQLEDLRTFFGEVAENEHFVRHFTGLVKSEKFEDVHLLGARLSELLYV